MSNHDIVAALDSLSSAIRRKSLSLIDVTGKSDTTSFSLSNARVEIGWGFATGTGASFTDKATTFSTPYSTTPFVLVSPIGYKDGSNPSTQSDFGIWEVPHPALHTLSATGFSVRFGTIDGSAIAATRRVGFTWIAVGI